MFVPEKSPNGWPQAVRMARAVGLDLPGAVLDGWLTRKDLSGLIARCGTCGKDKLCADWVQRPAALHKLPEFCPNKSEMDAFAI